MNLLHALVHNSTIWQWHSVSRRLFLLSSLGMLLGCQSLWWICPLPHPLGRMCLLQVALLLLVGTPAFSRGFAKAELPFHQSRGETGPVKQMAQQIRVLFHEETIALSLKEKDFVRKI